jgi:hypothetical protein
MARRPFAVFNMSFLDCMACGFGAVLLVFLILSAQITEQTDAEVTDLRGEALRMEVTVAGARGYLEQLAEQLVALQTARASTETAVADARGSAQLSAARLEELAAELAARDQALDQVKSELKSLASRRSEQLEQEAVQENAVLRRAGAGQRQYLTGLRTGGRRVLILLDTSASMLARNIVNIVRLRNMDPADQRRAPKWKQAVGIVEWLAAQLPAGAEFQIYGFGLKAEPLIEGTQGRWVKVAEEQRLREAIGRLRELVPSGGTSLHAAFEAVGSLKPRPDNVHLVVDGLPTQGTGRPQRGTVSGATRLRLFNRALRKVPSGVPVNVILLPMEGDPDAATAYWTLARRTRGSFMSPAADWP